MMVDYDDVRLRRATPSLKQETAVEVRALEAGAQVRLRRHRVPHVAARLVRQVGERAVAGAGGPRGEGVELSAPLVLEQRVLLLPRLVEPRQADVVPPALEEREARRVVAGAERAGQNGQVLPDQLLLEVDRVGRDDGPLAVLARPHERRDEVSVRLPHPSPRLEHPHAALVVEISDVRRHVTLGGPVLEAAEGARHRSTRGQKRRDVDRVDPRGRARPHALHDHVAVGHVVVDDPEPHAAVVQPGRHREIGAGRLEHAARVVVEQQLAAYGDAGQGEHGVHGAARHHPRLDDQAIGVGSRHERDLAPVRGGDFGAQQLAHRRRETLRAHVLSSRFLAAGKSTLLRISR